MWVVKLGGSLLGSSALQGWLDALVKFGDGKVVVVPGGGLFADAVREAQFKTGIDDKTAHQMAVVAMDQYASLMVGLNPELAIASSELEIAETGWQHRAIVWKPSPMVLADEDLPTSWDLTSDSLAAWLADKLNAEHLLIVKSAETQEQSGIADLIASQVLDPYFSKYALDKSFATWLLAKNDYLAIHQTIKHQSNPPAGQLISNKR
ncbi:MAG: hypothetical protein RLZZ98_247 [Pseudomonadota bacterium]|jgi:aspartokinase-like uncharacterized kinase